MPPVADVQAPALINSRRIMLAFSAAGTILVLAWVLTFSAYGMDFTDEGFYLTWISNPFAYDASITQFGFVYHPLYLILGGDIAALRQANVLITFALAWALTYTYLKVLAPDVNDGRLVLHCIATGLATSSFLVFDRWLLTPNYNTLSLQALLLAAIGLLLADKTRSPKSTAGWIIIGAGGWLAFMAKPSTALALSVGALVYFFMTRRFSFRMAVLSVASALLLLLASALLIDGSVAQFVERLRMGVAFSQQIEGGHTLRQALRLDDFYLTPRNEMGIIIFLVTSLVATWGALSSTYRGAVASLTVASLYFALIVLLAASVIHTPAYVGSFQGLQIFGVVFSAILIGLIFSNLNATPEPHLGIALLFFVMPHIFAFGTNNNYWHSGISASIFWVLAGLTALGLVVQKQSRWSFALPLVLAVQTITAALVQTALERPYRQPQPLTLNDSMSEIGAGHSKLLLNSGFAEYLATARNTALSAGLKAGTPMIDLTGQSPGMLYALEADSIGQPWTIGGYPGSLDRAVASLSRVSCEKIASAWILREPNGPRSIPDSLLATLGADFPRNYKLVAKWATAEGAGGYKESRTQLLYAPTENQGTYASCLARRSNIPGTERS